MPAAQASAFPYPCGVPRTFVGAFRHWAARQGDKPFLKCQDTWFSWRAWDDRTDVAAAKLGALGVRGGTRVAFLAQTSVEVLEAYFAAAKLGAELVPLNIFLRGEFLRHQIAHSRAAIVVADVEGARALANVAAPLPDLERRVLVGPVGSVTPRNSAGFSALAATECSPIPPVYPDVEPTDPFQILYTSGTTGPSKGCLISNRYFMRVGLTLAHILGATHGDVRHSSWPIYHVSGSGALAECVLLGNQLIVEPEFVADGLIERMARDGVTHFVGSGVVGRMLLAQPPARTDRAHSIRIAGLVPCGVDIQEQLVDRFGFGVLGEFWAQTECTVACGTPITDRHHRPGTSGRPMPDVDVALLDDHDIPVAPGAIGEICIRPREPGAIFDGYLDDPVATLAAMRNLWFHSGDLGRMDDAGNITFVDRKKDMVRRSGENVSSFELEAALRRHPSVADAAIHETAGVDAVEQDIVAWLVLEPGATLDPGQLAEFLWDNVPFFAIPRYVRLTDELPMTPTGRVQKYRLRELGTDDETWDLKAMGLLTPKDRRR